MYRLNADGSTDTSYGTAGETIISGSTTNMNRALITSGKLAIDANGKAVIAGGIRMSTGLQYDAAAFRLNTNGTMDTTFGSNGIAQFQSDCMKQTCLIRWSSPRMQKNLFFPMQTAVTIRLQQLRLHGARRRPPHLHRVRLTPPSATEEKPTTISRASLPTSMPCSRFPMVKSSPPAGPNLREMGAKILW